MASLKDLIVMGPARFLDKLYGNLEGNATSATKLATARTINGTSFDGSSNITTANWGTARNLSISSTAGTTGTSVNGSANAVLIVPSDMIGFNSIKVNYLGLGGYDPSTNYQINFTPNKAAMSFRSSLAEYDTYIYYGTSGNEALTFATTNTVTHIQFANGHALSNFSGSYWNTIAPAMDIANNNVHIGGIAGTDYKFKVTGTSYFSDAMTVAGLFTYAGMQTGTADAARCVWFSDSAVVGRPVYDTTFTYNPVSKEIGTIKRISHPAGAALHLGNADNENWVATQDIRSHSGADYWVISAAGSAWFKKINLGYTYGNGGSYLLNVNGNTMLAGTVYLDTAASTYISSTYYTGTSARSNILTNNPFTTDNIDNVTDNGLHFGTISSYATPGFSSNDGLILSMSWNTGNAYGAQLGFDDISGANMYVRNKNNSWSGWERALLSNNYTDYTVKKDGTGASGTWGINVTGYSKSLLYPSQLTTDALIDAFNTANTFQVTTWNSTSTPGVSNGILISTGWTSASYGAQIAIDDDPTYYIALRQRDGNGWKAWKRIPMGDGTGASGTWGIGITGNAATATKLQTARTIFGQSFNGTANVAGQVDCYGSYTASANQRYYYSALEIRENGLVGNAQSDIGYAPSIGFHWANRTAATLNYHSDGIFYFRKQDGTSRATIDANVNGWASSAGSASTATYLVEDESFNLSRHSFQYFNISGTAGAAVSTNDTPTTAWWHIQRHTHANSAGYYTDVAIPFNDNQIYYKRVSSGSLVNGGWVMLYDTKSIIYSSTEPTSGLKAGMIWLKPV